MGWSPEDWEVITEFQLLKSLGVHEVECMHIIALMAPLFNMNNKKLGRDTMRLQRMQRSRPMAKVAAGKDEGAS
jgi:hypothetical protein